MLAILQKFGYLLFVIRFSNWLRATILTVINQQWAVTAWPYLVIVVWVHQQTTVHWVKSVPINLLKKVCIHLCILNKTRQSTNWVTEPGPSLNLSSRWVQKQTNSSSGHRPRDKQHFTGNCQRRRDSSGSLVWGCQQTRRRTLGLGRTGPSGGAQTSGWDKTCCATDEWGPHGVGTSG